jgi:two-component system cell cycle sensor histidine kinase/response regulator CckA
MFKKFKLRLKRPKATTSAKLKNAVNSMVPVGIFIATIYWALDSVLHIFFANRFNVIAQMVGPDLYEIYIRVIILCLFIIFGSHAQYTINDLRSKEEELTEYRNHLEELVKERTAELLESNRKLKAEIHERRRSEQALRNSEEKYRLLVEHANDAIFIIQDGRVKFPNPKAESLSRKLDVEIHRTPFFEYIHPDDRENVLQWYRKRLKNEDVPGSYLFKLVNNKEKEIWVELNAVLVNWENKIAALNFMRDVTSQKNLEYQFQQSQRMESIGTLAGGIAHDFNNLLMGIQGNAAVLLLEIKPEHPLHENVKSIERCVKSGSNLTRQLLGFARGGKYVVKPTGLNELMARTAHIFGRTRREINIHTRYRKDLWLVSVDVSQIEQVLLNLYVNSWHAMPDGGAIYLETDNVVLDETYTGSKPFNVKPGKYVKVSVTDTGTGMDKNVQKRIFEPFFTTKEIGQGTGLGLASVYGIVKNHGGIINCYSELGSGTTFNIYLPAYEKAAVEEVAPLEETLRGTETILLVDDEKLIVNVGKRMMESLGYRVLPAANGEEAIKVFSENQGHVDLVILDMIMPYMSGGEVFDRLREIEPTVRVLLSSGYSINGQAEDILARGCNGFLQKPFNTGELSRKIREVLDTAN